ncbi:hypothetical protein PtB15_7B242 [Puccinia triticina]|nr:hypothetical protein PtB15_7B242 [Puccinia triticina]
MLFSKHPDAKEMDFTISTYAVVPMFSNFGIVQHIPGCSNLRKFIAGFISFDRNQAFSLHTNPETQAPSLHTYPSEPNQFIRRNLLDRWIQTPYLKKRMFNKTTAIHSALGYLFGVGDRHPGNILVSDSTYEVIHIDYGICFGQGLNLICPELGRWHKGANKDDELRIFKHFFSTTLAALRPHAKGIVQLINLISFNFPTQILQQSTLCSAASPDPLADFCRVLLKDMEGLIGHSLPVDQFTSSVLNMAKNPEALARMYCGMLLPSHSPALM